MTKLEKLVPILNFFFKKHFSQEVEIIKLQYYDGIKEIVIVYKPNPTYGLLGQITLQQKIKDQLASVFNLRYGGYQLHKKYN